MGPPPLASGDFLAKRKSPKIRQEPPGLEFGELLTSGTRGRTPLDSPAFCPSGIVRDSLNPQASSGASHLPSHGLAAGSVTPGKTRGEKKTGLPTSSKWQIGLFLWQKVARRETERSAASAKRAVRDGCSFQFNRACAPSLEPDCVRFLKFCWNPGGFQRAQPLARLW